MKTDKLKKNKTPLIVAIVIILFSIALYVSFKDHDEQNEQLSQKTDRLVEFNGSQLEEKKDGKLVWRLTAERIQVDPDTKILYITHPQAVIADVDGKELTIDADKGTVDQVHKKMEINAPIKATTPDGDSLQTDGSIYYNMDTRMINGGKVQIHRSDNTDLSGDSFETNAALDQVSLTGHAKVTRGE